MDHCCQVLAKLETYFKTGYPKDIFLNDPSDMFICSICSGIFKNAVTCTNQLCGNTFCSDCIKEYLKNNSKCPACENETVFEKFVNNQTVNNFVKSQNIRCITASHLQVKNDDACGDQNLCNWTGKICELDHHLKKTCQYSNSANVKSIAVAENNENNTSEMVAVPSDSSCHNDTCNAINCSTKDADDKNKISKTVSEVDKLNKVTEIDGTNATALDSIFFLATSNVNQSSTTTTTTTTTNINVQSENILSEDASSTSSCSNIDCVNGNSSEKFSSSGK